MSTDIDASLDKLSQDFQTVVADAQALLRATANETGERAAAARERVLDTLHDARQQLSLVEEAVAVRAKAAVRATDDYVHEHPWKTAGIAAGVGLVVGLLIGRR
jgi:ElaB/YqjD/DUF883 family membrane-anchored ribosome-binding protein